MAVKPEACVIYTKKTCSLKDWLQWQLKKENGSICRKDQKIVYTESVGNKDSTYDLRIQKLHIADNQ